MNNSGTDLLRSVTMYNRALVASRNENEAPNLSTCFACSKVPASFCKTEAERKLGGVAAMVADGGSFSMQSKEPMCPHQDFSHREHDADNDSAPTPAPSTLHARNALDRALESGLLLLQPRQNLRSYLAGASTFRRAQPPVASSEAADDAGEEAVGCGLQERKMLADAKPTSLEVFDKSKRIHTVAVKMCTHGSIFPGGMVCACIYACAHAHTHARAHVLGGVAWS